MLHPALSLSGSIILGSLIAVVIGRPLMAQTTLILDGTTATNINNAAAAGTWEITGGTPSVSGTVKLHSFTEFSIDDNGVNPNDVVRFVDTSPNLETVVVRVTGNSGSNILGTLETVGDFDLFLVNPNGISFGPRSVVDTEGSFLATTAESIIFDNSESFSAASLNVPNLTINLPVSLRFGATAERIEVNGNNLSPNLRTDPGNTFALIGGDIGISGGFISATRGHIALGSIAPQSTVNASPSSTGWVFNYANVQGFQDINLSQPGIASALGGSIQIQSRNFLMEGGYALDLSPTFTQSSGVLVIEASDSVTLRDPTTQLFTDNLGLPQNSGDVEVRTNSLLLDPGTSIRTSTSGPGQAGNISIYASTVNFLGSRILSESSITATQDAGSINIFTQSLTMDSGARISASTASSAAGGNVNIYPLQSILPPTITIDNFSRITTQTLADGQGGTIDIQANGNITVGSSSSITSEATANGDAGGISVRSPGTLTLQDSSRITVESVNGQGGALDVTANSISLRNNSRITSEASGAGSAGDITLTSEVVTLFDRSRITAATQNLTGGNITFRNQALIFMGPCEQGSCPAGNNAITASAAGTANGGNISMILRPEGGLLYSPLPLRPTNNDVIASAVTGNGGTINIQNLIALDPRRRNPVTGEPDPLHFVQFSGVVTPDSDLIASSAFGVDGTVELNFRQDLESDDLPSEFLGNELEQSCTTGGRVASEQERSRSTFTLTGQGGLAPGLDTPLGGSSIRVDPAPLPSADRSFPSAEGDRPLPSATARSPLSATPCQPLDP